MATLAAAFVKTKLSFDKILFYSFGSPRVGNAYFSDYIFTLFPDGAYSRITHLNDAVVHLPSNFVDYKHTGDEIFYKDDSDLAYDVCKNYPA